MAGILLLGVSACDRAQPTTATETVEAKVDLLPLDATSQELAKGFPLLPLVEKAQWAELVRLEQAYAEVEPRDKNALAPQINGIISKLREAYPFQVDGESIRLGEITYFKSTGRIEMPAKVTYPKLDQEGNIHELEVVLCTDKGRVHETLLMTEARPLHLELLLHLTGSKKQASRYRVAVLLPGEEAIPLETLLKTTTGKALPDPLLFKFTGSAFQEGYRPDSTGDLVITWHAHDAVLQAVDEDIAQARTRLLVTRHPSLAEGMTVHLALVPEE
ncbi:hypothetical protein Rhal01_03223 [Rubritalea halochordaticola]|uniref:Uncharacterized protein n=1 Tax=Rubritalea halochordaticola TaxID=714537 RepID=A0ABP9V4T9_9BACT